MDEDRNKFLLLGKKAYNISEILMNLVNETLAEKHGEKCKIPPSEYVKQMLLTTEERLDSLLKLRNQQQFSGIKKSLTHNFEVTPYVIVFQQFIPGLVYNVPLTIRNIAQVPQYFKSSCELHPFFTLEFRGASYSSMLAPGLSHLYNVKFIPEEKRDYEYQLKFVTKNGELVVPVIAIGRRGILDFPDRVEIPSTGVKISSSKSILVRNVGNAPVAFALYSDNPCFSIEPSKGRMEEEELLQFFVSFVSAKHGDFETNLCLEYDSGEKFHIELRCTAINCPIRVDRGSIRMEETYVGLSRSKVLTIHNRSNYIVKYQWMRFEDNEADEKEKEKFSRLFRLVHDWELPRCVNLIHYNICIPDVHQMVYHRIYADEIASLKTENFLYNHLSFMFSPEEGEIWPQSTTDVTVFFRALEVGEITSTAYLEVTGREDRIPVSIYATGKGPVFRLNVLTLDLQNIYLCSVHNYEIVVANQGEISGKLVYRAKPTDFGGTIDVTPSELELEPKEHKSFNLSFYSNRKGNFIERIDFVIKESLEVVSLHIKGTIVCPTLHFDKEALDFNVTPLGFSKQQEVCLHNSSLMPVTFSMRVLNDGNQPSLTFEEFAKAPTKPSFPSSPQEFYVSPDEGVVAAHSFMKIRIVYTPNITRSCNTTIQVDMWDSNSDPVTLPITFCGKVAPLSIKPAEISIRFCFIDFPYSRSFSVENNSELDGYFHFAPQSISENTAITYSLSINHGIVKAHQSKTINATIVTRVLGQQKTTLRMLTMGEKSPITSCVISCNGQGPVISAEPSALNFEESQILEEKIMDFTVISDAPIPASFKARLGKQNSPWSVSPRSGEIEPHGSVKLKVKLNLRDVGKYHDHIMLIVVNSRSIPVYVSAIGVGCSVVFEPSIFPTFDMGLIFSHQKVSFPITMTNHGSRYYRITLSNRSEVPIHRGPAVLPPNSKFEVVPTMLDVQAGKSNYVNCNLLCLTEEYVEEDWYIFGQIQGDGKRELIGVSTFTLHLLQPQIVFNKNELTFRIDVSPNGDKIRQTDELLVTNQSGLDLNVYLSVNSPFNLVTDEEELVQRMKNVLVNDIATKIRVHFSPLTDAVRLRSMNYSETLRLEYDEHPVKNEIKCKGSLNFPNLIVWPKDIIINCELGSSAEEILSLTNNGPVSVVYKFAWVEDSIKIKRYAHGSYEEHLLNTMYASPLAIQENSEEHLTSQDMNTEQNESAEGQIDLIGTSSNSPVTEKCTEFVKESFQINNLDIIKNSRKIRDFLLPMIAKYFVKDATHSALESLPNKPLTIDLIDKVLHIVPSEGIIPPYSIQQVHLAFHGFKPLEVKATVACEILRGPSEEIRIFARAGEIKFSTSTEIIDFGEQMFCESARKSFILKNDSVIAFMYKIDYPNPNLSETIVGFNVTPLKVEPNIAYVEAKSSVELFVEHQPTILGPIHYEFKLVIGHLMPLTITVTAFGSFPQVYISIPRKGLNKENSLELCYSAIQSLTTEFIISKMETTSRDEDEKDKKHDSPEADELEGWHIISKSEIYPRVMDIDMAIERFFASKFIDENSYSLIHYSATHKMQPILHLYASECIIDMNYVIVGLSSCYSTTIINYGPWGAEMRLRKIGKKDTLAKTGIVVHWKKQKILQVGDSTVLQITWHPTLENYIDRSTSVKRTVYLEVVQGCTIPITIKGVVTYPYLTVSPKFLDFQDVIVGECIFLCITVKNEGTVDCEWNAKLVDNRKKREELPFSVHANSNICSVGHSEVVRICFKPRKASYIEMKLNIIVKMGFDCPSIILTGRGIDHKLNLIEPNISFSPTVAFTGMQEAFFTIENTSHFPVEFFWHHLDDNFEREQEIAKTLIHYYQVEEILLPRRKLGDVMPTIFTEFRENLLEEMAHALPLIGKLEGETSLQEIETEREHDKLEIKDSTGENGKENAKIKKVSINKKSFRKTGVSNDFPNADITKSNCPPIEIPVENSRQNVSLPSNNHQEIQQLLNCYIESLHKTVDFQKKMKDPVKNLFDAVETNSSIFDNTSTDSLKPKRKVCIIFHGAPFTEYQETACRSAKTLGIPVLCIDKVITETVAHSESECALKLRQIIDDTYLEYIKIYKQYSLNDLKTKVNPTKSSTNQKSLVNEESKEIAQKRKKSRTVLEQPEVILRLPADPDPLEEFNKIPDLENLQILDPLSRYEYKIQTILHLQKILSTIATTKPTKEKLSPRTPRKIHEEKFLGIDTELLVEALEESLANNLFERGFIVQCLNSCFFCNDVPEALFYLLRAVGHVKYLLFVTFLNSIEIYDVKNEELRLDAVTKENLERMEKIQDIEDMTFFEYDLISDEDRKMYLEAVLPGKKEAALHRQNQFTQRMAEIKKMKGIFDTTSVLNTSAKEIKRSTTERSSREKKSITSSKIEIASVRSKSVDTSKSRQTPVEVPSIEYQKIVDGMERYREDLLSIENIIRNWDPVKKVIEVPSSGRNKIPKTAKSSSDKLSYEISRESIEKIHLWYVKSSDPWSDKIYNTIVAQMNENYLARNAMLPEIPREPDYRPKIYSILRPRNIQKRNLRMPYNVYQLASVSPMLDGLSVISESIPISDTNIQENHLQIKETSKNRGKKPKIRTEYQTVSNRSSNLVIEGKNTDVTLENIEESPKPRWIQQPNEIQTFKVRFLPKESGIYKETFAFSVVNGTDVTYEINVRGVADIPRVDLNPVSIFGKIENSKLHDANDPTYFLDTEIYDFGSLLVLRMDQSVHQREVEFNFRNISEVDVEIYFFLAENSPGCFSFKPEKLFIAPGNYNSLRVFGTATKLGFLSEQLHLCIKNNPKVETIKLQTNGTKLDIELSEKELFLGRVLLYRREFHDLTVRNNTAVAILWRIEAAEHADPQITFAPQCGLIKPWKEQEIEFSYYGSRVGLVEETEMTLKCFLHENDENPIWTGSIEVSGETYDVAVDIDDANPIDLKHVRVNFPTTAFFTIKNRGNYAVKYVIMLEDEEKLTKIIPNSSSLKNDLEIRPSSGAVLPQKTVTVEVAFLPKIEQVLEKAPILKCHLVDSNKETAIIAELPITVSLTAYYTRFQVYPSPLIDFGCIGICTEKTMYLNIENTGKFLLDYLIFLPSTLVPSVNYTDQMQYSSRMKSLDKGTEDTSRKSRKSVGTYKATSQNVLDGHKLTIGSMKIAKTEGKIEAGQIDSIAIKCYPEFVGLKEEEIIVLVPDSIPEDKSGKTIILSVNACMPSIDFENLDNMFQENHIVDRIQDFDCPKEIGAHTVFSRQEKSLHFRYVSVSSIHTTCFKLQNRNEIPVDVEVHILSESLKPTTSKTETFVVEPQRERIPPISHKTFTISFKPTIIGTFRGVIEASVDLPPHLQGEKFRVKLEGESCVPEVAILEPARGKREQAVLNFSRTLVGESISEKFVLENVGFVRAKVIVEICEDPNFLFSFAICSDSRHFLHVLENDCDVSNDRCAVIRLMPGNIANFEATFCPKEIGKYEGQVRLFIVDNPYENLTINLQAEAYLESIVLNGLELLDSKRKISIDSREIAFKARRMSARQDYSTAATHVAHLTYNLDYEACFINKMYKKTFRIANKSSNRWFRFEWSAHPDVVFVPSIGHVKYMGYKEITSTFLISEPTIHLNTRIECMICEIEIADPSSEMAWDDRQTEVRWQEIDPDLNENETEGETLAMKVVEPTIEPSHEVVLGTTKCIQVFLNAKVAFSEFFCAIQEIHFKDTLMFQTREYTFTLLNPGIVNMEYTWKISMDEQYPRKMVEFTSNGAFEVGSDKNVVSRVNSKSRENDYNHLESDPRVFGKVERSDEASDNSNSFRLAQLSPSATTEIKPTTSSEHCLSDLFSSNANLTERSSDSWLAADNPPFVIQPNEGILLPDQTVECTVKFSPMDVFYYKAYLTCRIENLDPNLKNLVIPVTARSLLPYCHFDVQESDYITSGRRDPKLPGPVGFEIENSTLWENIRVIEFKVVGIGETHVRKFHLINPTADDYHFSWKNRTLGSQDAISNFDCLVPEGISQRGKRTDLAFTFLADDIGIFESFWLFSIERYSLESLFLFVGIVTEPSVHCLTVRLNLKPSVLGISVRDSIRIFNNEDSDISFRVLEESLYSEGKFQKLSLKPMTGILPAKIEQTLWVEYCPTRVGEFFFSVQCSVKLMKNPLSIFISTSAYDIASSVSYFNKKGENVRANETTENIINFGKLMLKESRTIQFDIINSGKMAFYYSWDLGMTPDIVSKNIYNITVLEREGHVISDSRYTCHLTFQALQKVAIKNHPVILKITRGATYRFAIKAFANKFAVAFSFDRYDFGPCYINESSTFQYFTELRVTNSENSSFIIECTFEEKPHIFVDLKNIAEALAANSNITIPIGFRPLKEIKYRDCLLFTINSTIEKKIIIEGEGITYKIRLVNPRDKSVDLGSIPINKTVSRKVPVVNEGCAPLELRFDLMRNLKGSEVDGRKLVQSCKKILSVEQAKNDQTHASFIETKRPSINDAVLQMVEPDSAKVLAIEPSSEVILQPKKRTNVVVKFKPTCRMRPFVSKVALQTSSTILPLFVVRCSCFGAEFQLNRTYIPFGTIVQGCESEARIMLLNTGDVGARFKWNTTGLPEDLSITPVSGYCSPGMDVNFVIKFCPTQQRHLIEAQATIDIEKYSSLNIKITGGCSKLPDPIETVFFTCSVREKEMKSVKFMNSTNFPWKLKPEVTGDYFATEEILHVPPQTSGSCDVTYAPIVMNTEQTPHKGTLLLKLPDENTPLLYTLHGLAEQPQVLEKIQRQLPAKMKYTESLAVYNWLNRPQRFDCKVELIKDKSHTKDIPLYDFVGNSRIDVPPKSQRDYRAVFHSYKEFKYNFKVTFVNQDGEYQFYEIGYDVTTPESIESIKLITVVRSAVCYSLKLENPMQDRSITYTAQCSHPFISVHETIKTVYPLCHEYVTIQYLPLLPSNESLVTLNINCPELGNFPYELKLKATPPLPEKMIHISAVLGSNSTFSVSFKNNLDKKTGFTINVDNDCFECKGSIEVPALRNGLLDVIYEPNDIENVSANLNITSPTAGDYTFPIIGTYSLPKPLGPYTISVKQPATIPFKNVFNSSETFDLILDHPDIFSTNKILALESKQNTNIEVSLRDESQRKDGIIEDRYPVTGKLVVYSTNRRLSHVNWIYYLRGVFN